MPMTTIETAVRRDWIEARKARDNVTSTLLGTLVGAFMTKEKTFNPARSMTEAEIVAEIKKMLDGVVETARVLADMPERDDLRTRVALERVVLERYMPVQMTEDELTRFAASKKAEGMNMGGIMSALKAERGGQYDGKLASTIVKRVLG